MGAFLTLLFFAVVFVYFCQKNNMAEILEYNENIKMQKYYIVEVEKMREDAIEIKGEGGKVITLVVPDRRNNDTDGLAETGIVKSVPIGHSTDLIGKRIKFWFLNTDFSIKSGILIKGHVLVPEYDIIESEGEMYGDWIYCSTIEKKMGLIYTPTIQHVSYDSLEAPVEEWGVHHIDKGIVARKNNHFEVGTPIFWGNSANVRQNWEKGFLIKLRYVQLAGEDALKVEYIRGA